MNTTSNKPATWFWITAIIGLLWNLGGIASFIMQITMSEETLNAMPEEQRALYTSIPMWITVTYLIAVVGSTIGNILLLMRKRSATPVLIIAFVAIMVQMTYSIFLSDMVKVNGAAAVALPGFIILFGALLVWLSRKANEKGWLS